jgi:hypothetical protein
MSAICAGSVIIGMLSAIDRNQCPQSIGTPVRNPRNPHSDIWYETTLRTVRGILQARVESADTSPSEREDARVKLAHLDSEQWALGCGEQKRLNIIDAISAARATDRMYGRVIDEKDHEGEPDWLEVAEGLGLDVSPAKSLSGRHWLITHIIVHPPKLDEGRVIEGDAGNDSRD